MKTFFTGLLLTIGLSLSAQLSFLSSPAPGIAEVHRTEYSCANRTGATSFENMELLTQTISYFNEKGKLTHVEEYFDEIGLANTQQYQYNNTGQLERLTSESSGQQIYELAVRYGTRDSLILESFDDQGKKIIYVNDVLMYSENFSPRTNLRYISHSVLGTDGELDHQVKDVVDDAGVIVKRSAAFFLTEAEWQSGPETIKVRSAQLQDLYPKLTDVRYIVEVNEREAPRQVTITPTFGTYQMAVTNTLTHKDLALAERPKTINELKGFWENITGNGHLLVYPGLDYNQGNDRGAHWDKVGGKKFRLGERYDIYLQNDQATLKKSGRGSGNGFELTLINGLLCLRGEDGVFFFRERSELAWFVSGNYRQMALPNGWTFADPGNYEGLITPGGKEILPAGFRVIGPFGSNSFVLRNKNNLYGLIDNEGNFILPFEIKEMEFRKDGRLRVTRGGNIGIMNPDGKWAVPLTNNYFADHADSRYIAVGQFDSVFQVLDTAYQPVIQKIFNLGTYVVGSGYAAGHDGREVSLFTPTGEVILLGSSKGVRYLTHNRLSVKLTDDRYNIIDGTGKVLLTFNSEEKSIHDDLVMVYWQNRKCGLLSLDGHILTQPIYDRIELKWKYDRSGFKENYAADKKYRFTKAGRQGYLSALGEENME